MNYQTKHYGHRLTLLETSYAQKEPWVFSKESFRVSERILFGGKVNIPWWPPLTLRHNLETKLCNANSLTEIKIEKKLLKNPCRVEIIETKVSLFYPLGSSSQTVMEQNEFSANKKLSCPHSSHNIYSASLFCYVLHTFIKETKNCTIRLFEDVLGIGTRDPSIIDH